MEWPILKLDTRTTKCNPRHSKTRQNVRKKCSNRCVYCAIHENSLGGFDNFHIDHYRPKSIPRFKSLENIYQNLFYACRYCNLFKSNDWPGEPKANLSTSSYPNPYLVNYNSIFNLQKNGAVAGKYIASKYLVIKLYLNRPQLILERRAHKVSQRIESEMQIAETLLSQMGDNWDTEETALSKQLIKETFKMMRLNEKYKTIPPYELVDVRKPRSYDKK